MDMRLEGRTAFVSGSTQGIGFAIATALAQEGVDVVLNGRDADTVASSVARLQAQVPGAIVTGVPADLADVRQVEDLAESVGAVDILINNVGDFELREFEDISEAQWAHSLDVNLMSGVRLSRHALGGMLERGWGRIIFIGSESGVNVPADMIHYGVAKAGAIALANGLAKRTRGTAVTVNTILGGPTYSDGVASTVQEIARSQGMPEAQMRAAIIAANQTSLLERFLEPSEIAALAVYLASPVSSATNGAALRADGGVLTATT